MSSLHIINYLLTVMFTTEACTTTFLLHIIMTYIHTTSSPKFLTVLNLAHPTTETPFLRAVRTVQYLLSYTLSTNKDHFSIYTPTLPPNHEGADHTPSVQRSGHAQKATKENIRRWNTSLEQMLNYTDREVTGNVSGNELPSWLNTDVLLESLTNHNDSLPCHVRVLIVLVQQDIGTELMDMLIRASGSNPALRVFFLDVATPLGGVASATPTNIGRLLCTIKATYEVSDVSVLDIENRASCVQSYLNYLAFTDSGTPDIAITTENSSNNTTTNACISVTSEATIQGEKLDILMGTLCLHLGLQEDTADSMDTICNPQNITLERYHLLSHTYHQMSSTLSSPPPNCSSIDTTEQTESNPTPNSTHSPGANTPPSPALFSDGTPNYTTPEGYITGVQNTLYSLQSQIESSFDNSDSTSCVYGDEIYSACRNVTSLEFDYRVNCGVNRTISALYARSILDISIRVNNYSISGFYKTNSQMDTANRLCASKALDTLGTRTRPPVQNSSPSSSDLFQQPAVLWGYYSDASTGFLRVYPYSDCILRRGNDVCLRKNFDPRLRPWYTSTISDPKMVSLIIHVTRKENFEEMKQAGLLFVDTLSPRDHAAVSFNTVSMHSFAPATPANIRDLKDFINIQQSSRIVADQRTLNYTFGDVFRAFYESHDQDNTPCHNVVLLLSDSPMYDNLTNEIEDLQRSPRIDIFTYTFNEPFVDPTVPQAIACAFRGAWYGTRSPIHESVTSYLSFYSRESSRSEITWAGVIEDVLSQQNIFTGCLPVYQNGSADLPSVLIGVVCIDLDADKFQGLDDGSEALHNLLNTTATSQCSNTSTLTDIQRDFLRQEKCLRQPLKDTADLVNLLLNSITESFNEHVTVQALPASILNTSIADCPLASSPRLPVLGACDTNLQKGVTFSRDLAGFVENVSVSFDGLSVITNQSLQGNLSYLCPALIQQRVWSRLIRDYNLTLLQFLVSSPQGVPPLTLTYPALQLSSALCMDQSQLFEPYFSSTTSAGKDVIIILDLVTNTTAEQLRDSSYQTIIQQLLQTLAAVDYFTILVGNTSFSSTLVRANDRNLENVTKIFLPSINVNTDEQADMISTAFRILDESRGTQGVNVTSAGCQSAIIIITDRELDGAIPQMVQLLNQQYAEAHGDEAMVKIFVNSNVTTFENNGTTERNLTCNSGGVWNDISADTTLMASQKISSYYRVLSRSIRINKPLWSNTRHNRSQRGELITDTATLCQPLYNERGFLFSEAIGVTCISLPLLEVESLGFSSESLEQVIAEQTLECTTHPAQLDDLRPPEGRCAPPIAPTSSPSPLPHPPVAPTNITTPPPTTTEPSKPRRKKLRGSEVAALVVACGTILLCFFCVCVMGVSFYSGRRRSPRNRGKTGQDSEEFETNYHKLHENLIKEDDEL